MCIIEQEKEPVCAAGFVALPHFISALDIILFQHVPHRSVFFSKPSTAQERQWENAGFAYEILAPLI